MTEGSSERERVLDQIRQTYRAYGESGRNRLWDPTNPGYARIARDRDRRLVELIRRSLPPGGSVLDIGSGPGELADAVQAAIGEVAWTGVDLLPEAVEAARQARPWATWLEASADRLPFEDAGFDVVVASTLVSSLPSERLARDTAFEIGRVLRPGGWLVWYDVRYRNPSNPAVHAIGRRDLEHFFPDWPAELASFTLLPPIARRLGRLTAWLYPPLGCFPILRSHLIGRLQKPA